MPEIAERTWASADGLRLVADDYAPAPGPARAPVVCIHGLTRNARDFETVAPRIAAGGRRVLAVDVRGRGRSAYDPNPANYNPLTYAGDIIALLTQAGIARAAFLGTSMGGLITMTVAAMRPDLVAAAALNDIGPEIAAAGLARISGYVGGSPQVKSWDEAAAYARDINGPALPDLTAADWMVFGRRLFRQEPGGGFRLDYDPDIAGAFKAPPTAAPAAAAPDLWPVFTALTTGRPTLLVRGAASDILDEDIAGRMAAAAPQMARVEIPRVGHAPTLEEPQAAAAIDAWLARAP